MRYHSIRKIYETPDSIVDKIVVGFEFISTKSTKLITAYTN